MVILILDEHGRLMLAFDYVWQESARWACMDPQRQIYSPLLAELNFPPLIN